MEIKAAVVFEQSAKLNIETLQLRDPIEDEVVDRIVGSGICHTDLCARDQHSSIPS
jgi:aryl-alcohol dehydrogenase